MRIIDSINAIAFSFFISSLDLISSSSKPLEILHSSTDRRKLSQLALTAYQIAVFIQLRKTLVKTEKNTIMGFVTYMHM
jgi:hypothetical protein